MSATMPNNAEKSSDPWRIWAGRYAFLLAILGLLFAFTKGYAEAYFPNIAFPRAVRIMAQPIHLLLLCIVLTMPIAQAWQITRSVSPLRIRTILLGLIVFVLFFLTTLPLGNHWKFGSLFFEDWIWLCSLWMLNLGLFLSLAGWASARRKHLLERFGETLARRCGWASSVAWGREDAFFLAGLALFVTLVCLAFNATLFGGIPHVHDSVAQYFQAKVFANGAFAAPVPDRLPFFDRVFLLAVEDRWFSIYPPGHALIVSLGFLMSAPWLINPALAAASVPLLYLLAAQLFNRPTARLAALLWALSPFHLFMGAEYMNHTTALVFILIFFVSMLAALGQSKQSRIAAASAGFAFAFAAITRPLSALALGVAAIVFASARLSRTKTAPLSLALFFFLGALAPVVFSVVMNLNTTGDAFVSGYQRYFGGSPLGFGERPWGTEPLAHGVANVVYHTPMRGLANTFCNFNALNLHLFGWPIASLTFAFALFMPWSARKRDDWFCLAGAMAMPAAYYFYFYQDYCFGPRFYYESAPFWVLLSARGILEAVSAGPTLLRAPASVCRAVIALLLASLFAISISTTWVALIREYGDDYWGVRRETAQIVRDRLGDKPALVFVEYDYDYNAVFNSLDPWLERGPIFALDLGEETNRDLMRAYPDRPVYRLYLEPDVSPSQARTLLERVK